ncbi:MAG: hypothetical protein R3332_05960 [Pseudohongiellaceae bacterium]|nr:hypothetical protein [Pseudohongiellaceae bacterium]
MKWLKRLLWLCLICVLLLTNVITTASIALSSVLSGVMSAVLGRKFVPILSPARLRAELEIVKSENTMLRNRLATHKESVARVGQSITQRSKRLALYNITEASLGSVPIAGVTILVAGTVWELSQLCEGMNELEELYFELGLEEQPDSGVMEIVCNPFPINR